MRPSVRPHAPRGHFGTRPSALPAVPGRSLAVPRFQGSVTCPQDSPKLPQRPQVSRALIQDGGHRLTPPCAPRPDQRWPPCPALAPHAPCPHPTWRPRPPPLADGRDAGAAMLSAAASRRAARAALPEAGAGPVLTTWRPRAPPREEEAEGAAAAGGRSSLIHRTRRAVLPPAFPRPGGRLAPSPALCPSSGGKVGGRRAGGRRARPPRGCRAPALPLRASPPGPARTRGP